MTFDPEATEQVSLMRWTNAQISAADAVLELAMNVRRMALQARERYPANKPYLESCDRQAMLTWQAATLMASQYGTVRTNALAAFMRLEAPRGGSLVKEMRADNGAATVDRQQG